MPQYFILSSVKIYFFCQNEQIIAQAVHIFDDIRTDGGNLHEGIDAPWPATKEELIDYAIRSGAPLEVLENLQEIEDEGDIYESIEDIWPDYPTKEDFLFNEDEY